MRKFLRLIIDFVKPPMLSREQFALLAQLDTERFTLEEVCRIFGISPMSARVLCETAVRQQLFERETETLGQRKITRYRRHAGAKQVSTKAEREAYIRASDQRVSLWSKSKQEAFRKAVERIVGAPAKESKEPN